MVVTPSVVFCVRPQFETLLGQQRISAFVLLNGPIVSRTLLSLLRATAHSYPVVVADGAADLIRSVRPALTPSHIVGDMDSASSDAIEHFRRRGTRILSKSSQYANDFAKSMEVAIDNRTNVEDPIVVLGGQPGAGRLDHFFGNLQELCVRSEQGIDVWWLGDRSVSMVLSPGKHRIAVDPSREGPKCGLVPVAGAVERVTTNGLRWNFTSQETRFGKGGLVSSSNEIIDAAVIIETSGPLLWTCDVDVNWE